MGVAGPERHRAAAAVVAGQGRHLVPVCGFGLGGLADGLLEHFRAESTFGPLAQLEAVNMMDAVKSVRGGCCSAPFEHGGCCKARG